MTCATRPVDVYSAREWLTDWPEEQFVAVNHHVPSARDVRTSPAVHPNFSGVIGVVLILAQRAFLSSFLLQLPFYVAVFVCFLAVDRLYFADGWSVPLVAIVPKLLRSVDAIRAQLSFCVFFLSFH